MEDQKIIELYFARSTAAIGETQKKYGGLCRAIVRRILRSPEDCEECLNDTWLAAWNAIPPLQPIQLGAFLSRVTRNLALKKYEYLSAEKRSPQALLPLSELEECVSGRGTVEEELEGRRTARAVSEFLWQQDPEKRLVFLRRYWYFDSIEDICTRTGYSRSKVTSMLFHLRQKLREHLEKEGIDL